VNAEARTYKLGLDLPLSGIDGASAIPARNAVLLAIDEANRAGFPGGARVALSELDDAVQGKHDPAQGAVNLKFLRGRWRRAGRHRADEFQRRQSGDPDL